MRCSLWMVGAPWNAFSSQCMSPQEERTWTNMGRLEERIYSSIVIIIFLLLQLDYGIYYNILFFCILLPRRKRRRRMVIVGNITRRSQRSFHNDDLYLCTSFTLCTLTFVLLFLGWWCYCCCSWSFYSDMRKYSNVRTLCAIIITLMYFLFRVWVKERDHLLPVSINVRWIIKSN